MSIINASKEMASFAGKMEEFLLTQYPDRVDATLSRIHIGKNQGSKPGDGWRVTGIVQDAAPYYMELPEKVIPDRMLVNKHDRGSIQFKTVVDESAKSYINDSISRVMTAKGCTAEQAAEQVLSEIPVVGYKDPKTREMVARVIVKGVNDADILSAQVPFWNITYLNKVYKQPMLQGYAKHLITEIGVPNPWADAVAISTLTYEGAARKANVAKTLMQHNINEATKVRTHQIISEFINIVADFESSPTDQIYGGLSGNFLTGQAIGENEKYTRFMLEQLHNALIYFGDADSNFEGLQQLAATLIWPDAPFEYIYNDAANEAKGADMLELLNRLIGDMLRQVNFLATKVRICCSPTLYLCMKFALTSKLYNQTSPLKILNDNLSFGHGNKFMVTTPIAGIDGIQGMYEFCSDPMLEASTASRPNPFNPEDTDLMYITFPEFRSDMADTGLTDVIMAPVAISNMVLPYFYGNSRDGLGRTMMKRIGSLLCPVSDAAMIIRGIGVNPNYTP